MDEERCVDPYSSLQKALEELLDDEVHIYYQPPMKVKLKYPCIIFQLKGYDKVYADNQCYKSIPRYELMLITKDPESCCFGKILSLPMCSLERAYSKDYLYHYVFGLYYGGGMK